MAGRTCDDFSQTRVGWSICPPGAAMKRWRGPRGCTSAAHAAMITQIWCMRPGASSCRPSVVGTRCYPAPCWNKDGGSTDEYKEVPYPSFDFHVLPETIDGNPRPAALLLALIGRPSCRSLRFFQKRDPGRLVIRQQCNIFIQHSASQICLQGLLMLH